MKLTLLRKNNLFSCLRLTNLRFVLTFEYNCVTGLLYTYVFLTKFIRHEIIRFIYIIVICLSSIFSSSVIKVIQIHIAGQGCKMTQKLSHVYVLTFFIF